MEAAPSLVKPYTHWRNNKNGHTYTVIGVGRHSETEQWMVAYVRDGALWFRPYDLFLTKFMPIEET